MICNARLNLLILHPFPTPSQLPQQTGAQWPIYTEVPRNKNIYLQREGEGRREREDRERGNEERDRVLAHMSQLWTAWWWGGTNVLLASSHHNPSPIPFANLYLLALYSHLSVSKQNMSRPPILNLTSSRLTHIHRQCRANLSAKVKLVKSLKGGEQSKGHRGNSLNDCNLC